MHNKRLLLIGSLCVLMIAYLYFNSISNDLNEVKAPIVNPEVIVADSSQNQPDKINIPEISTASKQQLKLDLKTNNLSKKLSPFVIMETHKFCYRYFASLKNANNNYDILKRFNEKLSEFQ